MSRNSKQFALALLSLACLALLAACNTSAPVLRYITITPTSATTSVGGTQQFMAQAYYSNGSVQDGTSLVTWASSNTSVATIIAGGLATGVAVGTTTITASSAGVPSATATLTVNQLTTIAVSPAKPTVPIGGTQQFKATATFSDGTTGDITSTATWTSSNTAAATMDATTIGQADVPTTATAGATSTITAAQFGVSSSTMLTVGAAIPVSLQVTPATATIAVGNTTTFTATETWSDGTKGHPPSSAVTWSSGTAATASVLPSTGVALGLTASTSPVTITATEPSLSPAPTAGTAALTVVTGKAHYAYVSNTFSPSNIQSWTVNATTSPYLTPTTQNTFGSSSSTQPLIDPSGLFMYYTDAAGSEHVAKIDPATGTLTDNGGPTPSVGPVPNPIYAAIDPFGRFLYVANQSSGVYGFTFDPATHNLVAITSVAPLTTTSPESLFIDRTGSFLYVVNGTTSSTTNGTISTFNIDQTTGALTAPTTNPTIPTGPEPLLGTWDPSGTHLYIANTGDNSVSEYSQSSGALTNIGTVPASAMTGVMAISNVTVDPSGTHAYVLDGGTGTNNGQIFGFPIGSGGVINASSPATGVAAGFAPIGDIAIDPTGVLMAVDNNNPVSPPANGSISLYTISGGALTPATPSSVAAGSAPLYVVFYVAP